MKRAWTDWALNPSLFAIAHKKVLVMQSYKKAVEALQHDEDMAEAFEMLRESTVRSWYVPRTFQLKESWLKRWEDGADHRPRSGRPSIMSSHPMVEAYVTDAIINIRAGGGTVNSLIVRAFFRGYCRLKNPELLRNQKLGRRWCRWWLNQKFPQWTYKKVTTSGQKVPADAKEQIEAMGKRVAAAAAKYNITEPCFIINWDQTAVLLQQASHYTMADKKEKSVAGTGKEEKRQITAVVASTLNGDLLPLQLIFTGQDKNKKQEKAVPEINPVMQRRIEGWHLTQTYNHWSSLQSMKDYIKKIISPFVRMKGKELKLKAQPHAVLILDCWSVHTSVDFRAWMKETYPHFHLVYVPAGCTGLAQPADVILQRPLKAGIVNAYSYWMATAIHLLIKNGAAPNELKVSTGMVALKPLLVEWVWSSWRNLKDKTELIKKGWGKCGLGEVLEPTKQVEGLKFIADNAQRAADLAKEEAEPAIVVEEDDSDVEDETDESEDADVENTLAACLE